MDNNAGNNDLELEDEINNMRDRGKFDNLAYFICFNTALMVFMVIFLYFAKQD